METLKERFDRLLKTETDIKDHMLDLFRLALDCRHITEFGVRSGVSTTALYYGLFMARHASADCKLACYDVQPCAVADSFADWSRQAGWPSYAFYRASTLDVAIEETDLLFIDTWHTYAQLKAELQKHSSKARKWIVMHDTESFGEKGEDGGVGLWPAIAEFLTEGTFQMEEVHENQNGLVVLARR